MVWLIVKMSWPLWVFLLGVLALRLGLERLVRRARTRRTASHTIAHSPSPGAAATSLSGSLAELEALRRAGALTNEEFARAKDKLLRPGGDASTDRARQIRDLHELQRSGALSPSEFNSKKWEILARP